MALDINLLRKVCETPGAPGFEDQMRSLVYAEGAPYADKVTTDNMGNVFMFRKGREARTVMVAAHLDEIGFMVKFIDDQGFAHFQTLGGFDPKTLTAQRVVVHGHEDLIGVMGSKPIHLMDDHERNNPPRIKDYYIDLGRPAEEVRRLVPIGSPVSRQRELIEMGPCINCKSLDNRVSVYVLLEALRRLKNPAFDVQAVFTVQEEVGIRGAQVAAHGLEPEFGIGLDVTIAFDVPGAKPEEQITQLGAGVAIKIMDSSAICDRRMVAFMKERATQANITWQPEVLPRGGTDTAGIQRMAPNGAIAGAISIPTRHVHQVIEMAHRDDIEGGINLLVACLEGMDDFDWSLGGIPQ